MSFWQIVSANLCSLTINLLFLVWMAHILLGRIPRRGKGYLAVCAASGLGLTLLLAFLATVCFLTGVWHLKYGVGVFAWQYFSLGCEILFLWLLYRAPLRDCALAALMIKMAYSYGELLSEIYAYGKVYDLSVPSEIRSYLFWFLVIHPACLVLGGLVIDKSGAGKVYRQWLEQEKIHKGILAFLLCYPVFDYFLQRMAAFQGSWGMFLLLSFSILLLIHLIFVYAGRDRQQKEYIAFQQASLAQQAIYIEKMENLQSEFRRFRHDFKNMMAGMYLQAKEGDLESVRSFIQEMTEDFEQQMGEQVRLLNQLSNVQAVEVKGLLLEKISRMQKEGIRCELEVLRPFTGTRMRSTDLCRCLGILVDNAMDEVRGKEDARIHLMISSQNGCTTFLVKNMLYGNVDFGRMGTRGYTTKGEGHGIGLESYRKILEKYEGVFPCTAVRDGYFVQELKIQDVCGT